MHELSFASLTWREAPMPGGSGPVALALLPRLPDDAFRAFVRFPAGWSRPEPGYYEVAEEFLVLEGELGLNGRIWRGGEYAWIPARHPRRDLQSVPGCLVLAWFGSAPRWIAGPPEKAASDAGPPHQTRIDTASFRRSSAALLETLDLRDYTWSTSVAPVSA